MSNEFATVGADYGFHPYSETVTDDWLAVDIIDEAGVTAVFSADCRSDWPEELALTVQHSFAQLGLAEPEES